MEYRLKSGAVLTDEDIEQLSEAAARGEYPGQPGEWIIRPQGRPKLAEEDLVTIAFKVPRSQRAAVDDLASARGKTRSQLMRDLVAAALM